MGFSKYIYPKMSASLISNITTLDTPAVVYDDLFIEETLKNILNDFRVNKNVKLYYAVKANSNPYILKKMKDYNIGVDVASIEELQLIKELGFLDVSATNPSFGFEDIKNIGEYVNFEADSLFQLDCFRKLYPKNDIGIRVSTQNSYNDFGIEIDDYVLDYLSKNTINSLKRLHFHSGNLTLKQLKKQIEFSRVLMNYFPSINSLNMGGGLLTLYENRKDFLLYLNELNNDDELKNVEIIFEPGDALVKYSAVLLTKVKNKKIKKDKNIIFLDSSPWISAPWLYSTPVVLNKYKSSKKQVYEIRGCTMFAEDVYRYPLTKLPEIEISDYLLFPEYGGYTLSNYRSFHNIKKPTEYIYRHDKFIKIEESFL